MYWKTPRIISIWRNFIVRVIVGKFVDWRVTTPWNVFWDISSVTMINGFFLFQFKSLFSLGKFLISLKFDFLKSTSWKSEIKLKIQLSSLNHVTAKKNNNNLKRNQKRTKDILNIHNFSSLRHASHSSLVKSLGMKI